MKISRERLKQIIKEELEALALNEVKVYNPTTGKFEERTDEKPALGSGEVATGRLGPEATPSARTGPETMTAAERDALDQRPKTRAARAKARARAGAIAIASARASVRARASARARRTSCARRRL